MFEEYRLIQKFYGGKVANRSKVPLINHIDEGIKILDMIGADEDTKKAFCLHPLLQSDLALSEQDIVNNAYISKKVILLAMEYRNIANSFLCTEQTDNVINIWLSPLEEVNQMLVADKIQNRKDFELYHKGTHDRSKELDAYFKKWLHRLDISEERYLELINKLMEPTEIEYYRNLESRTIYKAVYENHTNPKLNPRVKLQILSREESSTLSQLCKDKGLEFLQPDFNRFIHFNELELMSASTLEMELESNYLPCCDTKQQGACPPCLQNKDEKSSEEEFRIQFKEPKWR